MAKNKKNKGKRKDKGSPKSSSSSTSTSANTAQTRVAAQADTAAEIERLAARAPEAPLPSESTPPPRADIELERSYKAAARAERAWLEATETLKTERAALADQLAKVRQDKLELEGMRAELGQREQQLHGQERDLAEQRASLGQREDELRARELDARAGFERERLAARAQLDEIETQLRADRVELEREITHARREADDLRRSEHEAHDDALARERQAHAEHLRKERGTHLRELRARESELEQEFAAREQALSEREAVHQAAQLERRRLEKRQSFEAQRLETRANDLERHVELRISEERERFELERRALERRLEQQRKHSQALDERLLEYEARERRATGRTREQLMEELEATRRERDDYSKELATRPSASEARELDALSEEAASLRNERSRHLTQIARLETRLSELAVAEQRLEAARTERDALEASGLAYTRAIQDLRSQLHELHALVEAQTPFPQCSAMDQSHATPPAPRDDAPLELSTFVERLQAHMACHSQRNYRPADLRAFLGGLAMSRLLLLQGFSGTGKTSLPIAFARAMGSAPIVIEVEAGWRDPQDLIGHYNTFEKRFYETELLQGLYRAQTPQWSKAVHIVVLDEMNLAHPEQYFSGFLSALQLDPGKQRLGLTTHRMSGAPELLEDGRWLKIPSNVWFVGTANHDETTKGFADKTYDRAHVMSLPDQPPQLTLSSPGATLGVDYELLDAAFSSAQREHADAVKHALERLTKLRLRLREVFGIGWGPRLDQQLYRYVPVVCAAGGTLGEALDHVLATRVLRKLSGRYDNRLDTLVSLRALLLESWKGLASQPDKSLELIETELRRLDPDAAHEDEA